MVLIISSGQNSSRTCSSFIDVDHAFVVFHFIKDRDKLCGVGECLKDSDRLILETCSGRPRFRSRLQGHKACKIEAIEVHWVSIRSVTVWLSEHSDKEPPWSNNASDA